MKIHLTGGRLILPDRVESGNLTVENGIISGVGRTDIEKGDQVIHADECQILPGYIDIHNHGGVGFDFSFGLYKEGRFSNERTDFLEGLARSLEFFIGKGTTRIFPTTLAAPLEKLEVAASLIKDFQESGYPLASMIGGVNLEGTFIKMAEYAGAQNPAYFYPVKAEVIDRLLKAFGGLLKIVNVPPEHGLVGLDLIHRLHRSNIVVSGGHSGASAVEYSEAVRAGLRLAVHFLNGPSRSSSKSFQDGGAVEAMLREEEVYLELITDGYHVHPAYIRDSIARKGDDKIILITDSVFPNGSDHVKSFKLSGVEGEVSSTGRYLQVKGKKDTLFGSVLSPDQGFVNMLNWLTAASQGIWRREHPALSFEGALVSISKMMSGNPARLLGLYSNRSLSDPGTGSIETGKWADLIIVKHNRVNESWYQEIEAVMLKGSWVYRTERLDLTQSG